MTQNNDPDMLNMVAPGNNEAQLHEDRLKAFTLRELCSKNTANIKYCLKWSKMRPNELKIRMLAYFDGVG